MNLNVVPAEPRHPRSTSPLTAVPTATRPLLLAEPNELARMGVHRMLERCAPGTPVNSVTSWREVAEQIYQDAPTVVFVSTELAGEPEDMLCAHLHRTGIHVVLLVRTSDRRRLRSFLRLPVSAVLHEEDFLVDTFDQLLAGLEHGVSTTHRHATHYLLSLAADSGTADEPPVNLTARELETLQAIARGLTNRQISRLMTISEHGVKRHVANVFAKLHATNRTMAVTSAIQRGLLPPPTIA